MNKISKTTTKQKQTKQNSPMTSKLNFYNVIHWRSSVLFHTINVYTSRDFNRSLSFAIYDRHHWKQLPQRSSPLVYLISVKRHARPTIIFHFLLPRLFLFFIFSLFFHVGEYTGRRCNFGICPRIWRTKFPRSEPQRDATPRQCWAARNGAPARPGVNRKPRQFLLQFFSFLFFF